MSVQSDIKTALTGIASNRVYPNAAPQDAARPFVVYRKVAAEPLMTLQGYAGQTRFIFAFECWADTYQAAITLADTVRTAVEAAESLKPQYRESADADEYENTVDEFVEVAVYTIWHS